MICRLLKLQQRMELETHQSEPALYEQATKRIRAHPLFPLDLKFSFNTLFTAEFLLRYGAFLSQGYLLIDQGSNHLPMPYQWLLWTWVTSWSCPPQPVYPLKLRRQPTCPLNVIHLYGKDILFLSTQNELMISAPFIKCWCASAIHSSSVGCTVIGPGQRVLCVWNYSLSVSVYPLGFPALLHPGQQYKSLDQMCLQCFKTLLDGSESL